MAFRLPLVRDLYALRKDGLNPPSSNTSISASPGVVAHFPSKAASIMPCQPPLMAPGALIQATIISSVGSRIAAMAARARATDEGGSSNEAVPISCWSAFATRSIMLLIDLLHRFSASDDLLLLPLHRFLRDRVNLFHICNPEELAAEALPESYAAR